MNSVQVPLLRFWNKPMQEARGWQHRGCRWYSRFENLRNLQKNLDRARKIDQRQYCSGQPLIRPPGRSEKWWEMGCGLFG